EDLERVEQLAAEEGGAARVPGEPRQGGHRGRDAAERAVVRLHRPDGDDYAGRDAVARADLLEQLAMRRERLAAATDQLRGDDAREILLEGEDRFRLRPIAFDDDRLRLDDV